MFVKMYRRDVELILLLLSYAHNRLGEEFVRRAAEDVLATAGEEPGRTALFNHVMTQPPQQSDVEILLDTLKGIVVQGEVTQEQQKMADKTIVDMVVEMLRLPYATSMIGRDTLLKLRQAVLLPGEAELLKHVLATAEGQCESCHRTFQSGEVITKGNGWSKGSHVLLCTACASPKVMRCHGCLNIVELSRSLRKALTSPVCAGCKGRTTQTQHDARPQEEERVEARLRDDMIVEQPRPTPHYATEAVRGMMERAMEEFDRQGRAVLENVNHPQTFIPPPTGVFPQNGNGYVVTYQGDTTARGLEQAAQNLTPEVTRHLMAQAADRRTPTMTTINGEVLGVMGQQATMDTTAIWATGAREAQRTPLYDLRPRLAGRPNATPFQPTAIMEDVEE